MLWLTKNFFDQPVKNDLRTYDNIWTFATGQGNDYATGFILDFVYFKYYYKLIVIGINKRNWCYPQLNQQINCWFTGNLEEDGNATIFFIIEEAKVTILNFSEGTVQVLQFYFALI